MLEKTGTNACSIAMTPVRAQSNSDGVNSAGESDQACALTDLTEHSHTNLIMSRDNAVENKPAVRVSSSFPLRSARPTGFRDQTDASALQGVASFRLEHHSAYGAKAGNSTRVGNLRFATTLFQRNGIAPRDVHGVGNRRPRSGTCAQTGTEEPECNNRET